MPGQTYLGSMGNNYAYNSITFAENEEASPWEPFHVRHGFRPYDSTVSVFGGCRATAYILGLREKHWREHVQNLLRGMNPHTPPALLLGSHHGAALCRARRILHARGTGGLAVGARHAAGRGVLG